MKLLWCLFLSLLLSNAQAQDYTAYNQLLKDHVDAKGHVNYKKLVGSKKQINQILTQWQAVNFQQLSTQNQLAFLVNLYNLATLKIVTDHYPISSIKDIAGGKVWDEKRISLMGKKYSLNEIENQLIRSVHKDARVHFVLNCAARSCPPLTGEALTGANLQSMLESRTKSFINHADFNTFKKDKIILSSIFDWYRQDFGNIIGFINRYRSLALPSQIPVSFAPYDWKLNSQ